MAKSDIPSIIVKFSATDDKELDYVRSFITNTAPSFGVTFNETEIVEEGVFAEALKETDLNDWQEMIKDWFITNEKVIILWLKPYRKGEVK